MTSQAANARGRPLPKFGEWDVNNPASAEGFTVIFNKARDQKKTNGTAIGGMPGAQKFDQNLNHANNQHNNHNQNSHEANHQPKTTKRWLCCFYAA